MFVYSSSKGGVRAGAEISIGFCRRFKASKGDIGVAGVGEGEGLWLSAGVVGDRLRDIMCGISHVGEIKA